MLKFNFYKAKSNNIILGYITPQYRLYGILIEKNNSKETNRSLYQYAVWNQFTFTVIDISHLKVDTIRKLTKLGLI